MPQVNKKQLIIMTSLSLIALFIAYSFDQYYVYRVGLPYLNILR